ncbi:MAG: cytochrome c oxidase assembly protein [Anaerolineales bacterium]|nr:cytochrome c oxidase assembly protein [Anaerolineales bacterium]
MDPVTKAVLLSWAWRWDVTLLLFVMGGLYVTGWIRLRKRTYVSRRRNRPHLVVWWRLIAYLSGLILVGVALMSPIDVLSQQLFFMHMIQHLLLIMIAPPLLMIANPMPFLLWGLPTRWRHKAGRVLSYLLHRESSTRNLVVKLTAPGIIFMFWIISVIGWHDPTLYNAALRYEIIHDIEHLFFFAAGMLFWWHVTGAGPRLHKQFGIVARIVFVLAAVPPNMFLGIVLAFASVPIYSYYEGVPRLWVNDVVIDQTIGGVIMWIPGSMMYIIAVLILLTKLFDQEGHKPPLDEKLWASDEAMAAPGIGHEN